MMKLVFSLWVSLGLCFVMASTGTANAETAGSRGVLLLMNDSDKGALSAPFVRAGFVKRSLGNSATAKVQTIEEAVALGKSANAQIVVLASVKSDNQGKIRSTQLLGFSSELHLKVWDVANAELVLDRKIRASGYGAKSADAKAMSLERTVTQSKSALDALIARVWPKGKDMRSTEYSLRIRGAGSWREISSLLQQIARTPGIVSLHILDIRQGRIRFQLRSQQGSASIVSSLRRARIVGGTLSVQSQGDAILVTLQMNKSQATANG